MGVVRRRTWRIKAVQWAVNARWRRGAGPVKGIRATWRRFPYGPELSKACAGPNAGAGIAMVFFRRTNGTNHVGRLASCAFDVGEAQAGG